MKSRLTQLKSIRWHCLDCSVGNPAEVGICNIKECALWEFRFGKKPTDEDIAKVAEIEVLRGSGYTEKTPYQLLQRMSDDEREARRIKYQDQSDRLKLLRCNADPRRDQKI